MTKRTLKRLGVWNMDLQGQIQYDIYYVYEKVRIRAGAAQYIPKYWIYVHPAIAYYGEQR